MPFSAKFCHCFSQFYILLPVLFVLLPLFECAVSASNQQHSHAEDALLEELVREVRKLNERMEGYGNAAEEEQMTERKRAQGIAPSVIWDGVGDKRAQLPFSGGIYGKRSPLPFSGGIYGKRSMHNFYNPSLVFPTFDRQMRAMPFNGGMYGK